MIGPALFLRWNFVRRLSWVVEAGWEHASVRTTLGDVRVDVVPLQSLCAWTWRSALWAFMAGLGIRGGYARLHGKPFQGVATGRVSHGAWLGPSSALSISLLPLPALEFSLSTESGYAALGLGGRVGEKTEVAVDGAWLSMGLNMAARW